MSEAPLVRLLTTGGTIATIREQSGSRTRAALSHEDIQQLAVTAGSVRIQATEIMRAPSWSLGTDEMLAIARAARDAVGEEGVAGVVVTHGTMTLEYTAFLADLMIDSTAPVVFTGAMRHADDPAADGPANLRDAVRVASSPNLRGCGVLVCFAGQVLAARSAWKRDRTATDAFEDLDDPIGRFDDGELTLLRKPPPRRRIFSDRMDPRVALIKAYPGADGAAIDAVVAGGASGVIVEGLPGAGGVPPGMQPAVRQAASAGIPVVVASRAPAGALPDPPTGGTGEPLMGAELVSAGDLTAEKAWVLLSVALAETKDINSLRAIFRAMTVAQAKEER